MLMDSQEKICNIHKWITRNHEVVQSVWSKLWDSISSESNKLISHKVQVILNNENVDIMDVHYVVEQLELPLRPNVHMRLASALGLVLGDSLRSQEEDRSRLMQRLYERLTLFTILLSRRSEISESSIGHILDLISMCILVVCAFTGDGTMSFDGLLQNQQLETITHDSQTTMKDIATYIDNSLYNKSLEDILVYRSVSGDVSSQSSPYGVDREYCTARGTILTRFTADIESTPICSNPPNSVIMMAENSISIDKIINTFQDIENDMMELCNSLDDLSL